MLDFLKSYLFFRNRFCGVEHTLKDNQSILYTTVLKKTKKEVNIDVCFSSKSIEDTANKLPKNQHIFLVINNDQVLTKSLKYEQVNDVNLINKSFPNINISEFYFEIIHQNDNSFVSICRKDYVDTLINKYKKKGFSVISFSLGSNTLSNTVSYIDDTFVFTSNASITTQNNYIKTIDYTETNKEEYYNINGLNVSNAYLLGFSGALSQIIGNYDSSTNYRDNTNSLLNTYKQLRFFNLFLRFGLVFILSVLLVNFLFFNFYYNQVQILNDTSQINQTTKSSIIKLDESVNKVKKTAHDLLNSRASKSSFYIDAIINSLPNSILLSEINYQPLKKTIKPDKPIENNKSTIMVSGESNDSSRYSEWITRLENIGWVKSVTVETYNDSKTSSSNFSIKIHIAP